MHKAVPATAACGVSPVVRISGDQGNVVKRADSGAHAVLAPLLYTVDNAKGWYLARSSLHMAIVDSVVLFRKNVSTHRWELLSISSRQMTPSSLGDVDAIAAVPDTYVFFVCAFDLGHNIDHPVLNGMMHDDLKTEIARIFKAANAAGKKAEIFCSNGDQGTVFADHGSYDIYCD
ncbi:hypothetical protein LOCC1_G000038 [Lachnellula occidentalis]|uniref:Uncharacterized protein n=1 Tax=Lachnellula occidentalis TaxID=215460 RepID=A0A8H8SAU4_9HELO|nr:hypothetical protein LOCC1_G000038 [Lachnellula occidentalis]